MLPSSRASLLLVVAALTTGCASMGAMQRADTLPPGSYQVLVETSVQNAVGRDLGDGERLSWPYLAVHYRRGLTERVEWSVGAALLSLKAGLKVRLNDPLDQGFALSVAPEVGGAIFGEREQQDGLITASLPLLLGWRAGGRGQWVLGPRVQYVRTFPASASSVKPFELFAAGASFGVALPVSRDFGLMPEVSVLSPIGRDRFELFERLSPKLGGVDGVLLQVGLGFLFGGFPAPQAQVQAP
ncbi:MAG: hypothetical protein JXB05_08195 [Myxococcaceae bacterium]|nr:hypothetical protein [Myxococcaceae bacterium]